MTTYSIWLMPSGDVYVLLARVIADLGRTYNAPLFEPHVTLLPICAAQRTRSSLEPSTWPDSSDLMRSVSLHRPAKISISDVCFSKSRNPRRS